MVGDGDLHIFRRPWDLCLRSRLPSRLRVGCTRRPCRFALQSQTQKLGHPYCAFLLRRCRQALSTHTCCRYTARIKYKEKYTVCKSVFGGDWRKRPGVCTNVEFSGGKGMVSVRMSSFLCRNTLFFVLTEKMCELVSTSHLGDRAGRWGPYYCMAAQMNLIFCVVIAVGVIL